MTARSVDPLSIVADGVRAGGVLSLVAAVRLGGVAVALFALVLLGLTLLRLSRVPPALDLATGTLLLVAAWCALLDHYATYPWLDVLVHLVATGLVAGAAHHALAGAGVVPRPEATALPRARLGVLLVTLCLGLALAVLWEGGEWVGHTMVDDRIQTGYDDTLADLFSGGLGAMLAGCFLARRSRRLPVTDSPSRVHSG